MPNPHPTRLDPQTTGYGVVTRPSARRLMPAAWAMMMLLLSGPVPELLAQFAGPGLFVSRSASGQFIVQPGRDSIGSPVASLVQNDTNFVQLDPTLLTVSCERIKQLVWQTLGSTAPYTGKVFLRLYPADSADSPVSIDAEQFRDGWQYRVTLPNLCQRERYVRAIVTVTLLELANRGADAHSAEVPVWLREGLSREIWASNQKEVILTSPRMSDAGLRMTMLMVSARKENSLDQAHQELCTGTPLSFQQLSWPMPDPLTGEPSELYRSCAQVFLHQLLNLPDGQASLRTMVQSLPRYYNWQFAFLEAFRNSFRDSLEVEKWWSLQLVHFTGRELTDNWSPEESWDKLDQVVRSAVQLRIGTNELPLSAEVPLQTIIRDWPTARQTQALENKRRELQMLRPRLARELISLVDEYCRTLESYIQNLNHPGFVLPFRKGAVARHNAGEALQRLDELDARRATLRPAAKPQLPVQADARAASLP